MLHTEDLFEQCMALRCEVKSLRHTVKEFKSGERYLKLQADQHRVIEGYVKDIRKLRLELADAHAAMNKTAMFLAGITGGELTPCEGCIAKLQKRAAGNLFEFRENLYEYLITRGLIYWDDTVIMIMTKRGCFRFYGDETIAYYTAHEKKDMAGIDEEEEQ